MSILLAFVVGYVAGFVGTLAAVVYLGARADRDDARIAASPQ